MIIVIIVNVITKAYANVNTRLNCTVIHIAVLNCSLSASVTPCNYEQTDSNISFIAKISCDSILKYTNMQY